MLQEIYTKYLHAKYVMFALTQGLLNTLILNVESDVRTKRDFDDKEIIIFKILPKIITVSNVLFCYSVKGLTIANTRFTGNYTYFGPLYFITICTE